MALSPADPYYRAEITPQSIADMAAPLCRAFGVSADAFGSKGNLVHTSGYHRSRNWILNSPDSRYGDRDYSVQRAIDKQGNADYISAFDFTPGDWGTADNRARMTAITKRMLTAAQHNDPRLADLFEVAGTVDGQNVITFYAQGGGIKDPFDSSHLEHMHGSFFRGRAANNHDGIVQVMLGINPTDTTEDDVDAFANIFIPAAGLVASVSVPGGGANARQSYFAATNDTGDMQGVAHDYGLRVYFSNGKGWTALGPNGGLFKGSNGVTVSYAFPTLTSLPEGIRGVSVMRAPINAAGTVVDPKSPAAAGLPVYDGPLTFCIERQ